MAETPLTTSPLVFTAMSRTVRSGRVGPSSLMEDTAPLAVALLSNSTSLHHDSLHRRLRPGEVRSGPFVA